jgi:hypothetical protein
MEQVFNGHQLCKLHGPLGPYFDSYAAEMCSKATHSRQERRNSAWLPISTDGWQDIGLVLRRSLRSCLSRFLARERDVDI